MGWWVGFDEESSGHRIYSPANHTVSIQCSIKFDSGKTEIYLPLNMPLEGETNKSSKHIEEEPLQEGPVDPLGKNFEMLPEIEGHPKRTQVESAAIR